MFGVGMNFGSLYVPLQVQQGDSHTIHLELSQTGRVQIETIDADGSPIPLDDRTLKFVVQDRHRVAVLGVSDGAISRGDGAIDVPLNAATTQKRRTLRWRLLDVSGGGEAELVQGYFAVH